MTIRSYCYIQLKRSDTLMLINSWTSLKWTSVDFFIVRSKRFATYPSSFIVLRSWFSGLRPRTYCILRAGFSSHLQRMQGVSGCGNHTSSCPHKAVLSFWGQVMGQCGTLEIDETFVVSSHIWNYCTWMSRETFLIEEERREALMPHLNTICKIFLLQQFWWHLFTVQTDINAARRSFISDT